MLQRGRAPELCCSFPPPASGRVQPNAARGSRWRSPRVRFSKEGTALLWKNTELSAVSVHPPPLHLLCLVLLV